METVNPTGSFSLEVVNILTPRLKIKQQRKLVESENCEIIRKGVKIY